MSTTASGPPDNGMTARLGTTGRLGCVIEEWKGHLSAMVPHGADGFGFTIGAVEFKAVLRKAAGNSELTLEADLGPLPYSAEDRAGRAEWFRRLAAADRSKPDYHYLGTDGRLRYVARTRLDRPAAPFDLVLAVVATVLATRRSLVPAVRRQAAAPPRDAFAAEGGPRAGT